MLIGLNGRIGAGKDTAKDRLLQMPAMLYPVVEVKSFATPLKVSAAASLGLNSFAEIEAMKLNPEPTIEIHTPSGTHGMTMRRYLEFYGTEAHRDVFGQDFWVDQALPLDIDHAARTLIFTDCRFPNEAARIRDLGGIVIEVIGPSGRQGNGHPSDTPLPYVDIDYMVDNSVRDDDYKGLDEQLMIILTREALGV